MSAQQWAAGRVTIDEGATVIDAEYRTDARWNGWLMVRTRREQALTALRGLAAIQDSDMFSFTVDDGGAIAVVSQGEPETYEPSADGWYYLGYGAWCWENAAPYEAKPHDHWYDPARSDWWCETCQTVTDYCQQTNPT